jgi:hypothetical protein
LKLKPRHRHWGALVAEWLVMIAVVYLFSRATLLDGNERQLQQTGEHSESATLPILAEIGLRRYGVIPLWNPYMLTGFPHTGDLINHFWNPVATVPVMLWGGITGMKVSVSLSLLVAAFGQWLLAHTLGVRGIFRMWAGLLFALSGGLVYLWWIGWYELLVGAAWFPWAMAAVWAALHRRDRLSPVLAGLAIAMVLTTGGGYYPLYLGVILTLMTVLALYWHRPEERGRQFRRAVAIAVLSAGLAAVYLVPLADGLRFTKRDTPPDIPQYNSQPIPYALFNYVVSDEAWLRTDILGKTSGSGWYFIGVLPLLVLTFTPWLYSRFRWRRRTINLLLALMLVLLAWHANRHTPVRYLYDLIPFLYTFRFPNRLLIIVASPLLVLATLNFQALLLGARRWGRGLTTVSATLSGEGNRQPVSATPLINLIAVLILAGSVVNVFQVNQSLLMAPHPRPEDARNTLSWLKEFDDSTYYVNIGGESIYWSWMAHAYELEMPVINFRYNRRVSSMDEQFDPDSPFQAQPKYIIAGQNQPQPTGSELVQLLHRVNIWHQPDVLPFAFVVADSLGQIEAATVTGVPARLDGPNRLVVDGVAGDPGSQLVVLVSDYPGWRLAIDGQRAEVVPVNGYLGAAVVPGERTYVFTFRPRTHDVGLAITILALLVAVVWASSPRLKKRARPVDSSLAREQDSVDQ